LNARRRCYDASDGRLKPQSSNLAQLDNHRSNALIMADTESTPTPTTDDKDSASAEHRFHTYESSRIPWYVRLIWILFWIFTAVYVIQYLFPDLQREILNPP
jgi:hypothetical protein